MSEKPDPRAVIVASTIAASLLGIRLDEKHPSINAQAEAALRALESSGWRIVRLGDIGECCLTCGYVSSTPDDCGCGLDAEPVPVYRIIEGERDE